MDSPGERAQGREPSTPSRPAPTEPGGGSTGKAASTFAARIADVCALLTFAVGLVVAVGWLFDLEPLKRVLPSLVAVKFNTAVGLLLGGAGLWWRRQVPVRVGCGALVALLGTLSLLEYLAGVDLGIDQLLLLDVIAPPEAAFVPGRMAPSTALCFLFLGCALARGPGTRPDARPSRAARVLDSASEIAALAAAIVGAFSLLAYPTGAASLRQLPGSVAMALPTAAAIVILGFGVLCAGGGASSRGVGWRGTGRVLWLGFGVSTCLLVLVGLAFAVNTQTLADDIHLQANVARPRREATLELQLAALRFGSDVRLAIAGDARARRAAADDARQFDGHLATYAALAESELRRELVRRVAERWKEFHAQGLALLESGYPPRPQAQARFIDLGSRLGGLLADDLRPEAVAAFEVRRSITARDLEQTGDLPLLLLVVGVLLAMVTAAVVARAVLRQERAVREQREWLRVTLSSIGDGVLACDAEGRITFVNPVAESLTGWPAAEAAGRPIGTIFRLSDERTRRPVADPTPEVLRDGRSAALPEHTVLNTRDGRELPVEVSAAPIADPLGTIDGVVLVFRDVTRRVEAEAAVRRANASLSEGDRRKDEFLAVLSHELRNPLAPIRNSLYVLQRAAPGGEQALRSHAVIDRQVTHLARLVDDLLDVTRITRGKIQLQRKNLELCEVVRRTAEDHRTVFAANGLRFEVACPGQPLWILGDATRIAQVVGNLLANAAKFTPRGGRVDLLVERDDGTAVVRVRDDGVGIAQDVIGRLFQPFLQAAQTLDRSSGGLGLGLALVKGLVELHGGSVAAHSAGAGCGAEFTVRLPLDGAPETTVAGPAAGRAPRRRVLIIEDNADAADSLKAALELVGHEVAVAPDGRAGLESARLRRPDVVLCDIGLPGIDGYQVARAFRADPTLDGVRLVALTGYTQPEDHRRAAEAGFERHVAKPPDIAAVEELLAGPAPRPT